jgi:hypothetical protein
LFFVLGAPPPKTHNDRKKRSALPKAMIAFDTQSRKSCR